MASAVIGLPTGPTDMMTSTLLSLIADETLFGSNWITPILPGSLGFLRSSVDSIDDLVGADAILPQDHLEQVDVARRSPDHAEPVADHLRSRRSSWPTRLRRRLRPPPSPLAAVSPFGLWLLPPCSCGPCPLRAWPSQPPAAGARHDEHHDVLAQDGDSLAVLAACRRRGGSTARSAWPLSIAAAAAGGPPSSTLVAAGCCAVARELRRDRLHHPRVFAVGRADGEAAASVAAWRNNRPGAPMPPHIRIAAMTDEPGVPHHETLMRRLQALSARGGLMARPAGWKCGTGDAARLACRIRIMAPAGRAPWPEADAGFGIASCTISISPMVSDVTRPTSWPSASTTPTAGALSPAAGGTLRRGRRDG